MKKLLLIIPYLLASDFCCFSNTDLICENKTILNKMIYIADESDLERKAPLHYAAKTGDFVGVVKILCEKNEEELINSWVRLSFSYRKTPLYYALENEQNEIVDYLLYKGADINARNDMLTTMLHEACFLGDKKVVEFLLQKRADLHAKDTLGLTPIYRAAEKGHLEIVKLLVENEVDIKKPSKKGRNILHFIAGTNHTDVASFFVSCGLGVNCITNLGETPLHIAVLSGKFEMVKFLVSNGARLTTKDIQNNTPVDIANKYNFSKITDFFESVNLKE